MLFKNTFDEISRYIPNDELYSVDEAGIEDWNQFSQQVTDSFWEDCQELVDLVSNEMSLKPFKNIELQPFYYKGRNKYSDISRVCFKLKEEHDFNMGLMIYPHFIQGLERLPLKHCIRFSLFFDGEKEVAAFKEMYLNYRRIIEIMFRKMDRYLYFDYTIDEPYSRPAEGKSIYYNLEKCFLKEYTYTPDYLEFSTISIYYNEEDIKTIFKVLIALLDGCFNYAIQRKSKDKILKYYTEIVR